MKLVDLEEPTSYLDHVYVGCPNVNANRRKVLRKHMFGSRLYAGATENWCGCEKPHAKTVAWIWKVMQSALKDIAILRINRQSSCTKSPLLAWTTIISRRRNWKRLENCPKYDHTSSQNACICRGLVNLTFCGLSVNLLEQSQKRQDLVTIAQLVWFLTFITRMVTDNFVMWTTRFSIVDWICSKTQALLKTLKTLNQSRGGSCVCSESEHSSPLLGCARKKVSIPQFYRIRNYFVGYWFKDERTSCSWPMGCDESFAFFEKHWSSTERSLSKRKERWSSAEKTSTQWNAKGQTQHQNEKTR